MNSPSHSKEFFELVRAIGETKSKQEEDKIILREIATLKAKMSEKAVPQKKMKEYLIRLVYCEMLGHSAEFGYIHAVNIISCPQILQKRVGYLTVSLCMDKNHPLMLLTVNRIQMDLQSSNYLDVAAALTAAVKLVNQETIPAVVPWVTKLLTHTNAIVRKKVVMVLKTFNQISKGCIPDLPVLLRRALCDRDPSVMAATVCALYDLAMEDPASQKDLVPSYVSILKQIIEHRLSRDFDYHRMPAPWVQIRIMKILAVLGADDKSASEEMYQVLSEVMKRADSGLNIGHAITYECVRTITSIYPNKALIEAAANSISRFITSENHNLKYLGITALASIVQIDPKYAAQHQMVVIDCLEDPDDTLKRKTLDLLYKMTNPVNVVVIVDKLIKFIRTTVDIYLRAEQVARITELAERFAPNNTWYIDTMNTVFEIGANYVRPDVIQNLLRLIAEGGGEEGEDEEGNNLQDQLRLYCVDTYFNILDRTVLPDVLIQVASWVLGEYGHLSEEHSIENIIQRLCDVMERRHEVEETRCWIINALMKLVAQLGSCPQDVLDIVEKFKSSRNVELQQRCYEFHSLIQKNLEFMGEVLPVNGGSEDVDVDEDLSFLDIYVENARRAGAKEYMRPEERELSLQKEKKIELKIKEYEPAKPQIRQAMLPTPLPIANSATTAPISEEITPTTAPTENHPSEEKLTSGLMVTGVTKRWTRNGLVQPSSPANTAVPTSTAPSAVDSSSNRSSHTASTSSITPTAATTAPTPAPEYFKPRPSEEDNKPKPSKKKQQLASALFNPEGDASIAAAGIKKTVATKTKTASAKAKTTAEPTTPTQSDRASSPAPQRKPQSFTAELDLLLDLGDGSSPAPKPNVATPTPAATNDLDILEGMTLTSPAAKTNKASPAAATTPTNKSTIATKKQQPIAPTVSVNNDPFSTDELFGALPPANGARTPSSDNMLLPTSSIISQIAQFPKSSESVLCQDQFLKVTLTRVFKNDALVYLIYFENQALTTLTNVNTQVQPPAKFTAELNGEPTPSIKGTSVTFASVELGRKAVLSVVMRVADISFGSSFVGRVSYNYDNDLKILTFNNTLLLGDLLRPHAMDVNNFGKSWVATPSEKKIQVPVPSASGSSAPGVAGVAAKLKNDLHLHEVQTIGNEIIASGTLLDNNVASAPNQLVCYVHSKVLPTTVVITVRSPQKLFAEMVARYAQQIFK